MTLAELKTADYALGVSIFSLAVAFGSLGFQLWKELRLDRASLSVEVAAQTVVGAGFPAVQVITVTVTNRGRRPTKLTSLWLSLYRSRWRHRKIVPRRWRSDAGLMMPGADTGVPQPEMPQVLDVGGQVTMTYLRDSLRVPEVVEQGWRFARGIAGASTASGRSHLVRVSDLV